MGAVIVPFLKQGSLGRDMNNSGSGGAVCGNQTNITLTFFWWLLCCSYLITALSLFPLAEQIQSYDFYGHICVGWDKLAPASQH